MELKIKDIVTLDDNNEYVVASKTTYQNKTYYYLIDKNNNTNIKFCYEDLGDLVEFDDKELAAKLLPLFFYNMKNELFNE